MVKDVRRYDRGQGDRLQLLMGELSAVVLLNPIQLPDPEQDAKDTRTLKRASTSVLNYGENGMRSE